MLKVERGALCTDGECTGRMVWDNGNLLVFSADIHAGAYADANDSCVVISLIGGFNPFGLGDLFCGSPRHYICYYQF